MIKRRMLLLALIAALSLAAGAAADTPPAYQLEGTVLEVTEDGSFLMENAQWGNILVKTDAATVWEGLKAAEAGAWVTLVYSGIMTKSVPPQVTAGLVICHRLEGTVLEADEQEGTVLLDTFSMGRVLVRLPETQPFPAIGEALLVYTDGLMALSDPAQVKGRKVTALEILQGTVSETGEGWFLLDSAEGPVRVNTGAASRMPEDLAPGDKVAVYYSGVMSRSIPPQVFGITAVRVGE